MAISLELSTNSPVIYLKLDFSFIDLASNLTDDNPLSVCHGGFSAQVSLGLEEIFDLFAKCTKRLFNLPNAWEIRG